MKLSKRELALFGLLIVVGGSYLLYYFVFYPLNLQITQMKAENISLRNELQEMKSKGARPGDFLLKKQQIWYNYERILLKMPQSPMIPNIIDFMEKSALEAGVKLLSISYKESPVDKKNLDTTKIEPSITEGTSDSNTILKNIEKGGSMAQAANFQLAARGTHLNLLSFLLKIENAPRIYRINSIKMIMLKNNQPKMGSEVKDPTQEVNSGKKEDFPEIAAKESQTYDASYAEVNLDFDAYYDSLAIAGINGGSSIDKDFQTFSNN